MSKCPRPWVGRLLLCASASACGAPDGASDSGPQLRAAGSFSRSPVTQAMLESEAESRQAFYREADSMARQTEERLRTLRSKAAPPNLDAKQRQQALVDLHEALGLATSAYVMRRRAISEFEDGAGILNKIFGAVISKGKWSGLATSIGTSAAMTPLRDRLDKYSGATAKYQSAVENAVQLALLQAPPLALAKYRQSGITALNASEAASELLGDNEFFSTGAGKNLSPEAKLEITTVQMDVLRRAVQQVAIAQQGGKTATDKLRSQAADKFKNEANSISALAKDVRDFKVQVTAQVDAVAEMATATKKQVEVLSLAVSGLTAQETASQKAMWRQMGPGDRLAALQDPNFLPGMDPEERKGYVEDLTRTVKVLNVRDTALQGLSSAGELAKIAAAIGLPIDVYNVDRNIATAESCVTTISAFAMGDYFGAIKGVAGMLGGGSPDPNEAQFARINAKLDEVLKLQRTTLERLEQLADQVAKQHQEVMRRLDVLDAKLSYSNLLAASQVNGPYADCRLFVEGAAGYGMRSGLYPTYGLRKEHFDQDELSTQKRARTCSAWLDKLVLTNTSKATATVWGGLTVVAPTLLANTWETGEIGKDGSFQVRFASMWVATRAILGWDFVDDNKVSRSRLNCSRIGLAHLARAPRRLAELSSRSTECLKLQGPDASISPDTPLLKSSLSASSEPLGEFDPASTMEFALSPAAAHHFGELVLFMAPFWELAGMDARQSPILRLPTLPELASKAQLIQTDDRLRPMDWSSRYLDVINVALAQQAVMAGVFIAPRLAEVLEKEQFGEGRSFPAGKTTKALLSEAAGVPETDQCAVNAVSWQADPYLASICLIQQYPWIRANVARVLMARDIQGRTSRLEYRYALAAEDQAFTRNTFPLHKTLSRFEDGASIRWRWSVRTPDGYDWTDVPSMAEMWSGDLQYPAYSEMLFDVRRRMEARVVAYAAHRRVVSSDDGAGNAMRRRNVEWLMRIGSMSERSLVEVPMTSFSN